MNILEQYRLWIAHPYKYVKPKNLVKIYALIPTPQERGGHAQEAVLGEAPGETLQEICDNLASVDSQFRFYYNSKNLTYWNYPIYAK